MIYLSRHNKADDSFFAKVLSDLSDYDKVEFYEKGSKYDPEKVKNADSIVIIPWEHEEEDLLLGSGTYEEVSKAFSRCKGLFVAMEDGYYKVEAVIVKPCWRNWQAVAKLILKIENIYTAEDLFGNTTEIY